MMRRLREKVLLGRCLLSTKVGLQKDFRDGVISFTVEGREHRGKAVAIGGREKAMHEKVSTVI
jgi:hypothetical protein